MLIYNTVNKSLIKEITALKIGGNEKFQMSAAIMKGYG
jgi:hypothetical protein